MRGRNPRSMPAAAADQSNATAGCEAIAHTRGVRLQQLLVGQGGSRGLRHHLQRDGGRAGSLSQPASNPGRHTWLHVAIRMCRLALCFQAIAAGNATQWSSGAQKVFPLTAS